MFHYFVFVYDAEINIDMNQFSILVKLVFFLIQSDQSFMTQSENDKGKNSNVSLYS